MLGNSLVNERSSRRTRREMNMKKQLGLLMVALATCWTTSLFAQETREGATVIRTGPGGEVQILSTETTTPTGGAAIAPKGR